jgi:hypothetical protein
MRNIYKFSVGQLGEKRLPRRFGIRWEDNIEVDLKETEWETVGWVHVNQEGTQWLDHMNTIKNVRVSYNTGYFLTM